MKATILDHKGKQKKIDFYSNPTIKKILRDGGEIVIPKNREDIYKFLKKLQKINPNIKIIKSENIERDCANDFNTLRL